MTVQTNPSVESAFNPNIAALLTPSAVEGVSYVPPPRQPSRSHDLARKLVSQATSGFAETGHGVAVPMPAWLEKSTNLAAGYWVGQSLTEKVGKVALVDLNRSRNIMHNRLAFLAELCQGGIKAIIAAEPDAHHAAGSELGLIKRLLGACEIAPALAVSTSRLRFIEDQTALLLDGYQAPALGLGRSLPI